VFTFLFFSFLLLLPVFAEGKDGPTKQVELVRPESYAVRRFHEVIDQSLKNRPQSLQEKLLRQRALLQITQTRLGKLQDENNPSSEDSASDFSQTLFRALEARVDHHQKKIRRLEEKIRRNRRQK